MNEVNKEEKPQPATQPEPSFWGKIDILMKPIGGLTTAAVVAYMGYLGSDILQQRQQTNARVQLYAQIMSSREQAETGLRREMFNSIIQTFLRAQSGEPPLPREQVLKQRMLALELLTYNFHDALDLGPLFKYLEGETIEVLGRAGSKGERTLNQLKRTARDIIVKQIAALEIDGATTSETFFLRDTERGVPTINQDMPHADLSQEEGVSASSGLNAGIGAGIDAGVFTELPKRNFRVEMIDWNLQTQELRVRLIVRDPRTAEIEFDELFWVGSFDFPLIDNTRLSGGGRCAVVLEEFTIYEEPEKDENGQDTYGDVKLNLVYFPGSRASLKSRPYYDEVIRQAIGQ